MWNGSSLISGSLNAVEVVSFFDAQEVSFGTLHASAGDARNTAPRMICAVVSATNNAVTMRFRHVST